MKMFGSGISYLTIDLIGIWKTSDEHDFAEKRDRYLSTEKPPDAFYYHQLDYGRMKKIVQFIDRYLDSVTPENEMKMEIYFNQDQPAFIDDEVNTRLFNFYYADKVYAFARENGLRIRIHTIVWYWHVPRQLTEYLQNRSAEDRKRLTFLFIKTYMQCLKERYPDAYSVELINEIAADPDEIRMLREEGKPVYEVDDEGVRIDEWYRLLGKHYYIEIFRLAREVFGDRIKLFYNDNNEGNREKQIIFKTVIDQIKAYEQEHGIRLIDGFGMQCHFWGSETETRAYMEEMFNHCKRLGVELQITEFDVSNHSTKEIQESIFSSFAEVASQYGIEVFTTWGLNDIVSWLHGEEASLVNSRCDPKPFTMKYIEAFSGKYNHEKSMEKKKMLIETTRLIVRPFREKDADTLYRIKSDPQVMEFCPDFLDVDAKQADMPGYIRAFQMIEESGDTDTWRCYAIESRETGEVLGALTFCKQKMLHEYDLGWMMISSYTGKGYASEAAEAFAEYFCRTHNVDYLTAVMDVDNPASRRTAEKSGFRLFEKRTVYDYHYNRYCDDYYYFRRYWSGCTLKGRYYGDSPYYGRSTSGKEEEPR